ncbi:hypothetical protein F5Y13DRAFT_202795 [Hypoxylon sp. FL1857]|nr:hypothetical protein F5Y13DRAFT_202795 [Hypoxylon sp. FL1857]
MHRRNSTKFHHLDRRKSISSVKSVHLEHIRPETAERDAQAAATQAFARARERSSTVTGLWPPPRNTDSSTASMYEGTPERRSNDSGIKRQQSIRFVRERVPQNIQQYTIIEDTTPSSNASTPKARVAMDSSEPRPITNASAAGMVSAAKGIAGDYISALLTGEEYYTREDDIASAPSSYRKVRKSRSMFTCSEASTTSRNYAEASTRTTTTQLPLLPMESPILGADKSAPSIGLKAPKSMSFLRGRRDQPMLFCKRRGSAPMGLPNNSTAITLNNKGPLKSHPSAFLRSRSSNADKVFRKSMRDDSNDTLLRNGKVSKDRSLRNRARKVSHNFKHKLKSFFNLVKGDTDEAVFPPQQIEASRSHITDLDDHDYMKDDGFQFGHSSDEAALSRVPSGVPSLHAVPSHQQLRSRQGSVESLRSERRASDERSRVTSWSNSDTNTVNTLNSHRGEWERQRLSVIKENGMHISSSSARYRGVTTSNANSNASIRSVPPAVPPQPATVDSQRIYSALMKRLNDTNKHSRNQVQKQTSVDDFIDTGAVPPRGSSRDHESRGHNSPATIRHVISDGFSDSSSVRTTKRKLAFTGGGMKANQNESPSPSDIGLTSTRPELTSSKSAPLGNGGKGYTNVQGRPPSVPHIEKPTPPTRTLSTRSSAFFASPTCHLFRTRSPYRRALQDSMRAESQNTQLRSPEYNPWMRSLTGLPIRCPSTCESEMDNKMHYAKSVYSTTTEELGTISSNNTPAAVEKFPKPPSKHGDATIFINPPVYRPAPPIAKQRVASSASSVEWKTWLSANVSKLESTPGSGDVGVLQYAVPMRSRHIREEAQIIDEDDQPPLEVYKPTGPDSVLATIEQNTRASPQALPSIVKSASPAPHCDKENEVPERPLATSWSALRTTPSIESMTPARGAKAATDPRSKGTFDSIRLKSLAHKPSLNTLAGNPTPTRRLVRKQLGPKNYISPTPSPGPKGAADKQLGKPGGSGNSMRRFGLVTSKTENVSPKAEADADVDPYGVQGSGVLGPETDLNPQPIGSKKIVDLFLSSRRRRMASGEDGGVFM